MGLTAGGGVVASDNVVPRPLTLGAAALRPPARPASGPSGHLAWPQHVLQEEAGAHENPFYLEKEPGGKPLSAAFGGE